MTGDQVPLQGRPDRAHPELQPLAEAIGGELGETNWQPIRLIRRMLARRGEAFVRELAGKAHEIEAAGGMYLEKRERRRTLGGVFFFLAKQAMGTEWIEVNPPMPPPWKKKGPKPEPPKTSSVDVIEPGMRELTVVVEPPTEPPAETSEAATPATPKKKRRRKKKPKLEEPQGPSLEEAFAAARAAAAQIGEVRTVKVTLIGRPGRVEKRDTCIVTTVEGMKVPSLPKGLPSLPATPTRYTVFIVMKQWTKVEAALAKDPVDELIIEGFAAFMPEIGGMGVYAANATTVMLQRGEREKKAPAASESVPPT